MWPLNKPYICVYSILPICYFNILYSLTVIYSTQPFIHYHWFSFKLLKEKMKVNACGVAAYLSSTQCTVLTDEQTSRVWPYPGQLWTSEGGRRGEGQVHVHIQVPETHFKPLSGLWKMNWPLCVLLQNDSRHTSFILLSQPECLKCEERRWADFQ